MCQKVIQFCILGLLLSGIAAMSLQGNPLAMVFVLTYAASAITGVVFTFMLSSKVYGAVAGIFLALLIFVPLVGLLVLFIINQRATTTLQLNGIRVGLMGAKLKDLDAA